MSIATAESYPRGDAGEHPRPSTGPVVRVLTWGLVGVGGTLTALRFMVALTRPVIVTVTAGLLLMLAIGMKRASADRFRDALASAEAADHKLDRLERMLDHVL